MAANCTVYTFIKHADRMKEIELKQKSEKQNVTKKEIVWKRMNQRRANKKMTNKAKGVRFYARQIHVFSSNPLVFKFYQIIMCECQRVRVYMYVRMYVLLMHAQHTVFKSKLVSLAIVLVGSNVDVCTNKCVYICVNSWEKKVIHLCQIRSIHNNS